MDSEAHHRHHNHHQLHILFFPFLAHGHMLPLVDMARLFAERGVKATIATTDGNVYRIRRTMEEATRSGHSMQLLLLPFPSAEVSLTPGIEHTASLSPASLSDIIKFHQGNQLLQQPLEELLRNPNNTPDCIISDTIYSWTSDLALSLGIPRLVFHGTSPFSLCISDNIESHSTHIALSGDTEPFVVPGGLPHRIELTKSELPITFNYPQALERFRDAERKSYGAILNSFYELAPEYVELCKMGGERKVWCVGPVWLCNRTDVEKAGRGGELHEEQGFGDIESWLDSKDPESVVYVCFGSECSFSHDQLREIAVGLEGCGHPFIWVVRGSGTLAEWLPEGFEKRVEGKGVIVKEWAPQLLVLNHPAIGGFMTHCGWNSVIEAVSAGVAMMAWPLQSEQFINEWLVVEVLGVGVRVLEGVRRTVEMEMKEVVKGEAVKKVVGRVMDGGEEGSGLRRKAKEYRRMARSAMEKGGSSYVNMSRLIEELSVIAEERAKGKRKEEVMP